MSGRAAAAVLCATTLLACNNTNGEVTNETRARVEAIEQDPAFDTALPGFTAGDTLALPGTTGGTWNHGGTVSKRWSPHDDVSPDPADAGRLVDEMINSGWTLDYVLCEPVIAQLSTQYESVSPAFPATAYVSIRSAQIRLSVVDSGRVGGTEGDAPNVPSCRS